MEINYYKKKDDENKQHHRSVVNKIVQDESTGDPLFEQEVFTLQSSRKTQNDSVYKSETILFTINF